MSWNLKLEDSKKESKQSFVLRKSSGSFKCHRNHKFEESVVFLMVSQYYAEDLAQSR